MQYASSKHIATLKQLVEELPEKPGVYLWKDKDGKALYIGKAKVLRWRARSYVAGEASSPRLDMMIAQAVGLDWFVTLTNGEALILEDHLIKTHKPKYNIRLKDNKTYPFLALTMGELFPRLILTRSIADKKSEYHGPYQSAFDARRTMLAIHKHFRLRKKKLTLDGVKVHRPCLNYHMGRCLAPCAGLVGREDYMSIVHDVKRLLRGDYGNLVSTLEEKMEKMSEAMEYEEAASIRDQIMAVRTTLQKQRIISPDGEDRDVICLIEENGMSAVQLLFVRSGVVLSGDFFLFKEQAGGDPEEIMRHLVSRIYLGGRSPIPKEIVSSHDFEALEMLSEYSLEKHGRDLKIHVPQRGVRKELLSLCQSNAVENMNIRLRQDETHSFVLTSAMNELKLAKLPVRIECFDVSNISGTSNVASMAVFENNAPLKSAYRKFKIRSFEGANDFLALAETLNRRMQRSVNGSWPLPDLMVIDGGVGQLNAALKVLADYPGHGMDVIGLAKGRSEKRRIGTVKAGDEDFEYVIKPNRSNPLHLRKNSPSLHLLQRIRDEAHRFAVSFHRRVRSTKAFENVLESIPGIGTEKRRKLILHFGGMSKIRRASFDELATVPSITHNDAQKISAFFASQKNSSPALSEDKP